MTLNDPLANVLSALQNAELRGKKEFTTRSASALTLKVLNLMKSAGYLDDYEASQDPRGTKLRVTLGGRINKVGVIKPRFKVGKGGFERFEKRFLPAKGFGMLIISTNRGLMTHEEAKQHGIGGVLVSYCY